MQRQKPISIEIRPLSLSSDNILSERENKTIVAVCVHPKLFDTSCFLYCDLAKKKRALQKVSEEAAFPSAFLSPLHSRYIQLFIFVCACVFVCSEEICWRNWKEGTGTYSQVVLITQNQNASNARGKKMFHVWFEHKKTVVKRHWSFSSTE